MVTTPRAPVLPRHKFVKALLSRSMTDQLTEEKRFLIANQFHDATVHVFTADHHQDEDHLPLKAANLKVHDPARWAFPFDSMLFETETESIFRGHFHDGQYRPTEIKVRPELYPHALEWELTSPDPPTYEPHPYIDKIGPNDEFRVYRCYHHDKSLDPYREFPVKVLYKKWNKDASQDEFFLHCVLIPLVLLGRVSETME